MTTNRRCHDGISYCYSGSGPCDKSKLPPDWNGMCAYQDRPDWWTDSSSRATCAWGDDAERCEDTTMHGSHFCLYHAAVLDGERMEREGK